jgi:hypothetical protein
MCVVSAKNLGNCALQVNGVQPAGLCWSASCHYLYTDMSFCATTTTGEAQQARGTAPTSSASLLRDAVVSSIQDVNAVLGHHAAPTTKLRVEARGAAPATAPASAAPAFAQSLKENAQQAVSHAPHSTSYGAPHTTSLHQPQHPLHRDPHSEASFLRELDEQADEPADPYELSQLSLMDIVASGSAYGVDAHSQYSYAAEFSAEFGYQDSDASYQELSTSGYAPARGSAQNHSSTGSNMGKTAHTKGKTGKTKGSGGIYGLLLQSNGAEEQEASHGAGIVPTRTNQVPGRVVGEAGKRTTGAARPAARNAAAGSAQGGAQAVGGAGAGAGAVDSTPRTQRATSLLAAARPSGTAPSHPAESYFSEQGGYGSADSREDTYQAGNRPRSGSQGGNREPVRGGPQEFVKQMSLAPQKPLTPHEKR